MHGVLAIRRRPVAAAGLLLAVAWIVVVIVDVGWFDTVRGVVSISGVGVIGLAGVVWLIERTFGDSPR